MAKTRSTYDPTLREAARDTIARGARLLAPGFVVRRREKIEKDVEGDFQRRRDGQSTDKQNGY